MAGKAKVGIDFTEGHILKKMIIFALPLLLANFLQQLYNAVDTMVIGHFVGSIGTVGVSNGGEVANFITFVAMAFGSAGQIYIAQLCGAKDERGIKETVGTLLTFNFIMAAAFMVLSLVFCKPLLKWLNTQEEAMQEAVNYMVIVSFGLPAVFGYNAVCGLLRGMGEAKRPLIFIAVSAVTNIVLDVLLVAVIPLAAAGTAIATIMAQYASFMAALVFMYKRKESFGFEFKLKNFKIVKDRLSVLVKLGIPMALQTAVVHLTQLYCTSLINGYGLVASATNSIGNKIYRLIHVMTSSINTATGAMVGQNLGAGKIERTKKVVYTSLGVCLVLACIESAVVLLFPKFIYGLFTKDTEVINFGVTYLRCLVIVFALSAFQCAFQSVVSGSGNAKLAFISGMLDGVVLRLGISLSLGAAIGVTGFFIGNNLAHFGPALIGGVYFFSGRWKTYKLLKNNKAENKA